MVALEILTLDAWVCILCFGFLDLDSWVWIPGFGFLGLDSRVWIPGFEVLGLDSWIWTPGLNLTDGCAETYDSGLILQIMSRYSRSDEHVRGNSARTPVLKRNPVKSWRAHRAEHYRGGVDWRRFL